MPTEPTIEEQWYRMLIEGESIPHRLQHLLRLLPSSPRCKMCNAPFKGWGGILMRMMGRDPSRYNPRFCEPCERFEHPGGAEGERENLRVEGRRGEPPALPGLM